VSIVVVSYVGSMITIVMDVVYCCVAVVSVGCAVLHAADIVDDVAVCAACMLAIVVVAVEVDAFAFTLVLTFM